MYKLIFATLLFAICKASPAQTSITLTNGEWVPYLSENLPEYGFASAVVKAAFKASDVDVEYKFFPLSRAIFYAKEGHDLNGQICHGFVANSYHKDDVETFYHSVPIFEDDVIVYTLAKRNLKIKTFDDLQNLTIGTTRTLNERMLEVMDIHSKLKIIKSGTHDVLFDRLLYERVDAIWQTRANANYFLLNKYSKEQRDQIAQSEVIRTRRYHLILNKSIESNAENIRKFNRGLRIIKENGTYDALVEKLKNGYFAPQNAQNKIAD